MIRVVVMMLIAANLLFFAWSYWVGSNDPRLTAVTPAAAATTSAAPAAPPAPPLCATIGPFIDELLGQQARQKLEAAGWGLIPRHIDTEVAEGWWVNVINEDAATQARTLNAIRRAGITDAFAMPDDAQFRVSVGIFSDEARAEDRAARVQRLRLDATVTERRRQQTETWFDVPGVARETLSDGRLASTGLPLERLRIEACPLPSSPPPAEAGAPTEQASPAAP